jgi:hypothetical protein
MKTKLVFLKLFIVLCGAFATTAAFGSLSNIWWIGVPGTANGTNFGVSTNWATATSSNNLPADVGFCQFNGSAPGDPVIAASIDGINHVGSGNPIGGGIGAYGVSIEVTSDQTTPVQIISPVPLPVIMGFHGIQVDAGAPTLTLGDNSANTLNCTLRPSGSIHVWANYSTNPVVLMPNFTLFNAGGSAGQVIDFQGTGNFLITNNLRWDNGPTPPATIQFDNTGATVWVAGGVNNHFNNPQGNVVINAGTVIVAGSDLLPSSPSTTTVSNGTLIVNGANPGGSTIVCGGTLGGTGILGTVTIQSGGTLAPGVSAGSVGTLTISDDLTLGGNLFIKADKSLSSSNDFVVVGGALTDAGTGMLTVSNLGPALVAGDKFTLFNQPVQNGAALAVAGGGANWSNHLAVDGSISVSSLLPPTLNFALTGGTSLRFSWTGHFKLQAQTNHLNTGLSDNWADYPAGDASPVTVPVNTTNASVFFRIISTP